MIKTKSILIIDDDPILLIAAERVLSLKGFRVVTINSGINAVEMMTEQTFDLVLLDHQMPIMDGFGTLKAIRQFWPEQKIVFCSTTVSKETLRAFSEAGANGAICKPTNITKLPLLVQNFL